MKDQFDLEQQIMACWGIVDDIKILTEHVIEDDATTDSIANTLIGIENLYRLKFEKLFRTFETAIKTSHQYELELERLRKRLEDANEGTQQEYEDNDVLAQCEQAASSTEEWEAPEPVADQVDELAGFPVYSAYNKYNESL
jgi:replication initiation and membrane attachment protein DnaB